MKPTREQILAADQTLGLIQDADYWPVCPNPNCGYFYASHWNGGIKGVHWRDFRGTNLNFDCDNGESEDVICPKCEAVYTVTQHVERNVTRTAEVKS